MDRLFQECFTSRLGETGYVFPLLVPDGDGAEQLRCLKRYGATECCLCRPGESDDWWGLFEGLLQTARTFGMRVWVKDSVASIEEYYARFRDYFGNTLRGFYAPNGGEETEGWCRERKVLLLTHGADSSLALCGEDEVSFYRAASLARLVPAMEGRAAAEGFSPWLSVGDLKRRADRLLACGINHFLPGADGFPLASHPRQAVLGMLMKYLQKLSRLTADSVFVPDVALLDSDTPACREACLTLAQRQISFDLIPPTLLPRGEVEDGVLSLNGSCYSVLVDPEGSPAAQALQRQGLTVLTQGDFPEALRELGHCRVTPQTFVPDLRCHGVDRGETSVYLLCNVGDGEIDTFVTFSKGETPVFFDVWNNAVRKPQIEDGAVRIRLGAGQAIVLLCGEGRDALPYRYELPPSEPLKGDWTAVLCSPRGEEIPLDRSSSPSGYGTVRAEVTFFATGTETVLQVEGPDAVTVTLNGRSCGTAVSAPYEFEVAKALRAGENCLGVSFPVWGEQVTLPSVKIG